MNMTLNKDSALSAYFRDCGAAMVENNTWSMVEYVSDRDKEFHSLKNDCVLADWSNIGKITLRGRGAKGEASKLHPGVEALKTFESISTDEIVIMRLVDDEYFIVTLPETELQFLKKLDNKNCIIDDQTGSLACLALSGPKRDEVLERSTAMNLNRERVCVGQAIQTTIHTITCTLYRTQSTELIFSSRDFALSLAEAFLDVGKLLGLVTTGFSVLPISLRKDS